MAEKKTMTNKESIKKIKDLKIELLKNPTKKKSIKKEIARLLTMERNPEVGGRKSVVGKTGVTKSKDKFMEDKK